MIRKWDVPLGVPTTLPAEAQTLHVGVQDDQLKVWTNDNSGLALLGIPNTVKWFATGQTPPPDSRYIGTVHDRGFVWHLFRLPYVRPAEES
jgi:hypothetical protein